MPLSPDIAPFLRDDDIGLRAPRESDALHAAAWFSGPLPVSAADAHAHLTASETAPWGNASSILLIAEALATAAIVGGVRIEREGSHAGRLILTAASPPVRTALLGIVTPWARDELDLMVLRLELPADDAELIARAHALGYETVVRLREACVRAGRRVDRLTLECVNPRWSWVLTDEDASDE